jgi:hypothetical protein
MEATTKLDIVRKEYYAYSPECVFIKGLTRNERRPQVVYVGTRQAYDAFVEDVRRRNIFRSFDSLDSFAVCTNRQGHGFELNPLDWDVCFLGNADLVINPTCIPEEKMEPCLIPSVSVFDVLSVIYLLQRRGVLTFSRNYNLSRSLLVIETEELAEGVEVLV